MRRAGKTDARRLRGARAVLGVLVAVLLMGGSGSSEASTLPAGFADQAVANVPKPTAFAFVPGGRILITSQLGQLYVYDGGSTRLALNLDALGRVCNNAERGLLGVAVDPAFPNPRSIYLYYTYRKDGNCGTDPFDLSTQPVNRVSRFVLGDDDVVDPGGEQVLIDNIPTPSGIHNAGDLQFGKDGYLYVSVGDGGCDYLVGGSCGPANTNARQHNVLLGKVLRITAEGDVPPGNPFVGLGTSRCNTAGRTTPGDWCRETFAWGLRNPFRLAFDSNASGTRFFINDVGQEAWEEIDEGAPGADYGWNVREGPCATGSTTDCGPPPDGITNPVYSYAHSGGCSAVTAGAFVPTGAWPSAFDSHYLYADFVCQKLFDMAPTGSGGYSATEFGQIPDPVGLSFGPYGSEQALYYLSYNAGSLRRIVLTGIANRPPHASATANPTSGALPLSVDFSATQSSDPDDDPLAFDWDFGDGSGRETTAQATHVYPTAGLYTATVTVSDGRGGSDSASVQVHAGTIAPSPSIQSPAADHEFAVGETITLSGQASDPQDGTLGDSALSWEVIKHHATHTHPFLPPTTGNNIQFTAPFPEDLQASTNSYLEVRLTATNSHGVSTTVSQNLRPDLVKLTFGTEPPGLHLTVNGENVTDSVTSWRGWRLEIAAPDQVDSEGQGETFVSWSDGATQTHTITTPATGAFYSATFSRYYPRPRGATPLRVPLVPAYRPCDTPNRSHGAPLADPSCSPPRPASDYVTVGTPDANGRPAQSVGYVKLRSILGNSSTPQNEADIRIVATISDVLDSRRLVDYVGALRVSDSVRLTDRLNGSAGTDAATTSDFSVAFTMPCTVTSGAGGSTCTASTTENAIAPGAVVEGKRAIWQIGSVQITDGGADGDPSTAGNTLFATEGVFVP